ncbi:unnamed protein product, partial [Iphiclides podalirius]
MRLLEEEGRIKLVGSSYPTNSGFWKLWVKAKPSVKLNHNGGACSNFVTLTSKRDKPDAPDLGHMSPNLHTDPEWEHLTLGRALRTLRQRELAGDELRAEWSSQLVRAIAASCGCRGDERPCATAAAWCGAYTDFLSEASPLARRVLYIRPV